MGSIEDHVLGLGVLQLSFLHHLLHVMPNKVPPELTGSYEGDQAMSLSLELFQR